VNQQHLYLLYFLTECEHFEGNYENT